MFFAGICTKQRCFRKSQEYDVGQDLSSMTMFNFKCYNDTHATFNKLQQDILGFR